MMKPLRISLAAYLYRQMPRQDRLALSFSHPTYLFVYLYVS